MNSQIYFTRLRRRPGMLAVVAGFILLTVVSMNKHIEAPPFYIWTMYSGSGGVPDTVTDYLLEYNDGRRFNMPEVWNHHRRIMFNNTIACYQAWHMYGAPPPAFPAFRWSDSVDARAIRRYPAWLRVYMQDVIGEPVDRITVYRTRSVYGPDGRVRIVARQPILEQ